MNAHRTTANEAVQVDLGSSSFEAREVVAKLNVEKSSWSIGEEQ